MHIKILFAFPMLQIFNAGWIFRLCFYFHQTNWFTTKDIQKIELVCYTGELKLLCHSGCAINLETLPKVSIWCDKQVCYKQQDLTAIDHHWCMPLRRNFKSQSWFYAIESNIQYKMADRKIHITFIHLVWQTSLLQTMTDHHGWCMHQNTQIQETMKW